MMELKELSKGRLSNMEHLQYARHVLTMCKESKIKKIAPVLVPLEAAIEAESVAVRQPRKTERTEAVLQADKERDRAYRALVLLVQTNELSNDEGTRIAAAEVRETLTEHPHVRTENYNKETALLERLVKLLRGERLAAYVKKMGAEAAVERLERANKAIDEEFVHRLKARPPRTAFNVLHMRAQTDDALRRVARRLTALDELEPDTPGLSALFAEYNAVVEDRRAQLAQHSAATKSARERRRAAYGKLLAPLIGDLEKKLELAQGSLSFTGKWTGYGAGRKYLLASSAGGEPAYWVRIKGGKLVVVSAG